MRIVDWKEKKVKHIFELINGGTPRSTVEEYWCENGIVWITPEDLSKSGKTIDNSLRKISELGLEKSPAKLVRENSIVISTRAPIGNIKIATVPFATNQGCKSMQLLDNRNDIRFFYYWLYVNKDFLNHLGRGTTFLELSNYDLKNIKLYVPSNDEQNKIANFMDKKFNDIDSLIFDKQLLIKLLEKKRQAIITETVTKGLNPNVKMKDSGIDWIGEIPEHWKVVKLKRYLKVHNGREIENELDFDNDTGINVYGSGGVFKKTDKYLYHGESVLFGRKGTIGKPLYVNKKFWTVDTMYFTTYNDNANPKYFYYVLKTFPWKLHTTQTALPSIVGSDIENEYFVFPSYKEQKQLAKILDIKTEKIDKLRRLITKQIEKLKEYRESLIYEAVTGKIDLNCDDSSEE